MRYALLLLILLLSITGFSQKRQPTYQTFESEPVYNLIIQLPAADLYFSMDRILKQIDQHDWSIAGKSTDEVSKLKSWLRKYTATGLVVTPTILNDKTSPDYSTVKLLTEYVSGIMIFQVIYGKVYKPGSKVMVPQPVEFKQITISKTPMIARHELYFKNESKPFLVTQGIGYPEEKEEDLVATFSELKDIPDEEMKRLRWRSNYDYTSATEGYSTSGITSKGDTIEYSTVSTDAFKGGSKKLVEFLAMNGKFPESAVRAGIYGAVVEVYATFMKDGSVRDLVAGDGDPRLHDEAIRLLAATSGMWTPQLNDEKQKVNKREVIQLLLYRPSR